jgi:hypothetical protein
MHRRHRHGHDHHRRRDHRDHRDHRDGRVLPGNRHPPGQSRYPRYHPHCGSHRRHRHPAGRHRCPRGHHGHWRQDHHGRRRDHHHRDHHYRDHHYRDRVGPGGSACCPGWGEGASCQDSASVRRCRQGHRGQVLLLDCCLLAGAAGCPARQHPRTQRVVAPTDAMTHCHPPRRGCCPPVESAGPASAPAYGAPLWTHHRRPGVESGAARQSGARQPGARQSGARQPGARQPGARQPPAPTDPPGAPIRPDAAAPQDVPRTWEAEPPPAPTDPRGAREQQDAPGQGNAPAPQVAARLAPNT